MEIFMVPNVSVFSRVLPAVAGAKTVVVICFYSCLIREKHGAKGSRKFGRSVGCCFSGTRHRRCRNHQRAKRSCGNWTRGFSPPYLRGLFPGECFEDSGDPEWI